ncbi:MAG TPA: hypothetical protein VNO50_05045 [Pyrinomonadaceae bacterium]|nr:hypothetical protein [Pyrinomonadaceae bacterium]
MSAVMQVVASREPEEKFDWSKTWVQEMFLSTDEKKRRKEEIERQRGITPEIKRYNEIKAGVIVSSVGIALRFSCLSLWAVRSSAAKSQLTPPRSLIAFGSLV